MQIAEPKISIICPSYNHEKYVKYFIDSVLSQTVQDFELIIVDDCSVDNTVLEIEKYKDDRIKLIKHSFNQGINSSLTDGINAASSNIICTIASDDMLVENYIEEVLKILKAENVGVVYVSLDLYDENNNRINEQRKFNNKDNYEVLRDSFISENQVPSPGMAFKKSAIEPFLPLPKGLIQYSDWDLHNKLLGNNKIYITDKCLIKYRISQNSASARSDKVIAREQAETDLMMDYFLNIKDIDLFKKTFKGCYEQYGEPIVETIPYFLGRIALKSHIYEKQLWGYKTIIKYVSEEDNLNKLYNLYGLCYANIISLVPSTESVKNESNNKISYKWQEWVFSVKNSSDKKHKIITILGIKIKLKRR